ncbi:hypothetical protein BH09VER1_BH09VER1_32990 [soil metagenome]
MINNKSSSALALVAAAATSMLVSCKPSTPTTPVPPTPPPVPTAAVSAATPAPAATTTPAEAATPAVVTASTPETASPAASPEADSSASLTLKDPVAVVNGEPISKAKLDEAFNNAVQATGMKADTLTPEQKLEGYRQLLDELIVDKLVTKASEGVVVPQSEVDAELAKIKSQFPNEEAFNKQLTDAGQDPAKIGDMLQKMLQQQHWMEAQLGSKVNVTDDEAKKFYESNKAEFAEPDQVKASHILFLVKKDDSPEVAKAKLEAAKKAEARAKKGEDFTKLAKELSEEPGAKESGGDLDYFSKDKMVPEFADAAFAAKVGSISDPVKTQFGYHIIKVTDKKPAHTMTFDEVKKQLIAYLKQDKQRKATQELLKSLRDSAKIENTLPAPKPEDAAAMLQMPPGAPSDAPAATPAPDMAAPAAK